MSGHDPQHDPWFGQPDPTHRQPPAPSPTGGGGRGWMVIAVVAVVALLAGGGFTALQLAGDSDDSAPAAESAPSEDPTTPGPTPTDPAPTPSPVATDPWSALPPDAEVDRVADALEDAGYACYDTLNAAMLTPDDPILVDGEPVLVRRCYLDPATGRDEEQTVSLQASPDGSVNGARVTVSALLDRNGERPTRWFTAAVHALTGPILRQSEAREILAGRTPDPAWGSASLHTNPEGTSYRLELAAEGSELRAVPPASTGLGLREVREHYSSAGYSCRRKPDSMVCEQHGRGYALTAIVFDPCQRPASAADPACQEGRTVRSLTLNAEFDTGMPDRVYGRIFNEFITGGVSFAYQDEWGPDIDAALAEVGFTKPHRGDVEGLHVEFLPGTTASFAPHFDQAYQVVIEGVCATAC